MGKYDLNRNWENELAEAQRKRQEAEQSMLNMGSFNYNRQADYDNALNNLVNREKFKYDLDKDTLYKQIRDNYSALGKIAMQDTMGQASAMTGGYGNSYAASAGQQAYNRYMQMAQDSIPQLYQMALDRYNAEGQNLSNNLNALSTDRNSQYGMWQDAYNRAMADRDYAGNRYNAIYNAAFEAARAATADEQWDRQFALSQAKSSGGGSGRRSGGGGKGKTDGGITALEKGNANTDAFIKSIPTENGFYARKKGGQYTPQKAEYSNYKDYNTFVKSKLDNALEDGSMSLEEAAYLINYYRIK